MTNYWFVTYASIFGDDPNPAVNELAKKVHAGTGGFITGSAAIDGVVTAIRRAGGSTDGMTLAEDHAAVQGRADALGEGELLAVVAQRLRPAVPRHQDPEQQSKARRHRHRQGRRQDLGALAGSVQIESERRPGETLRASSVSRSFEGVQALRGVDLELARGEVVGLIGPNGAGKSTLVNVLSGFDRPDAGRVELAGQDITRWSPHRRGRHGLARTFQHSRAFRSLSVRENVEVSALGVGARGAEATRRADALLERLGLARYADAPAVALAHGDERRLGVARALATEPKFVLLDEPAAGLPEAEVPDFAALVRSIASDHGAGVLLIDHNIALIMETCDRIQVLDQGTVLAEGAPAEIRANLDVAAAYLGETPVPEE